MTSSSIKLNIGCGQKHKEGFINIDIAEPADLICKVGVEKLPFDDDSVDEAEADNFLEHLSNEEFLFALNDLWRVMKTTSRLWIRVPDTTRWPEGSFGDPTHKMFLTARTFDYFTPCGLYRNHGKGYGFKLWVKVRNIERVNGFLIVKIRPVK